MKKITPFEFAQYFDNTNLKAFATHSDIEALCKQSVEYKFKTVAVNACQVERAKKLLAGSGVGITATVAFPLGQMITKDKVAEAKSVLAAGATDVDYVINITELKAKNYAYTKDEMQLITDVCHEAGQIAKVIFENAYLTGDEKKKLCEIALETGIDFVKTSTGFAPTGATLEDVALMKSIVGDKIGVKAAGGVQTMFDAFRFIDAGATRIGASSGAKVLDEYKAYLAADKEPDIPYCSY
ncbi:MAG: deoxyribose-phosphate aldolase [Bifidobacteriaceae bacterium]|jgi:deoxyribose-phosphate aldolase|nr:deoxyribose-phosphate aldolase [Bifidobacteriaceae bacterium]